MAPFFTVCSQMTTDLKFDGGHIFNNREYPFRVMSQSIPMLKQMGKNVNLDFATVDIPGATRDLAEAGYSLRHTTSTEKMSTVYSSFVNDRISEMLRDLFEENIKIQRGTDVILVLMMYAIDNLVAETDGGFFASSECSEGHYFSYQLAFYSKRKASFCFLVLSLCAFKEASSVFGIPTTFRSGIAYNAQVLEVKKTYSNILYEYGRLQAGTVMSSRDGRHRATLTTDGNFVVDSRWQSDSAGKGKPPYFLAMQEDANLCVYDGGDNPVWASGSHPGRFSVGPYRLELQDDGNLVVYDKDDRPLWAIGI